MLQGLVSLPYSSNLSQLLSAHTMSLWPPMHPSWVPSCSFPEPHLNSCCISATCVPSLRLSTLPLHFTGHWIPSQASHIVQPVSSHPNLTMFMITPDILATTHLLFCLPTAAYLPANLLAETPGTRTFLLTLVIEH